MKDKAVQKRFNRAKGQVEAIGRMVQDERYCLDIIQQIRAATNALKSLEQEILKGHLECCVKQAMISKRESEINIKVNEILKLWN